MKIVRLIVTVTMFFLVAFPQITGLGAYNSLLTDRREISVPVSDTDEEGVVGLKEQSSIQAGESEQELAEVTNNLDLQVQSEVELHEDLDWNVIGDSVRILDPQSTEVYNVDTSRVNQQTTGNYVIEYTEGSIAVKLERSVNILEPSVFSVDGETDLITTAVSNTDRFFLQVDGERINTDTYTIGQDVSSTNSAALELRETQGSGPNPGGTIYATTNGNTGTGAINYQDPQTGATESVDFEVYPDSALVDVSIQSVGDTIEGGDLSVTVDLKNNRGVAGDTDVTVDLKGINAQTQTFSLAEDEQRTETFNIGTQVGDGGTQYDVIAESNSVSSSYTDTDESTATVFEQTDSSIKINKVNEIFAKGVTGDQSQTFGGDTVVFNVSLVNNGDNKVTEIVESKIDRIGKVDSQQLTLQSGEADTVELEVDTEAGDGRNSDTSFSISTESDILSDTFSLKDSSPVIDTLAPRWQGRTAVSDIDTFGKNIRDTQRDLEFVEAEIFINGTKDSTVTLVNNGQLQNGPFNGATFDGNQLTGQPIEFTDTDARGGVDDIEIKLTVIDEQGAKTVRTGSSN